MFRQCVVRSVGVGQRALTVSATQNAGDPVQQIFLDKLKTYTDKMKSAGGKMVDVSAGDEKALNDEMNRVAKTFRIASQQEASTFPTFNFTDPEIDSIHLADVKK